jgi:Na+-transporting methylmalonyl-CoA/oxaloacetate decarboxylase gamma subunit
MSDNLSDALLISLFGMGIVFGIIVLLWGIMAALTRIPPGKDELAEAEQERAAESTDTAEAIEAAPIALPNAACAAAAAVAVALALAQSKSMRTIRVAARTEPSTHTVSAWQSVMRGRQLKQTYRRPRR